MNNSLSTIVIACSIALGLAGCQSVPPTPKPVATTGPAPSTTPVPLVQPMVERRASIVSTGYAVISVQGDKAAAPQQRLLAIRAARIDAYRGLVEQVYGLYLDSTTTIAEMMVKSDSFRARVEGVIYGATLTSITPVNNDTYEVTLTLDSVAVNDLRALYLEQLASKRR